MSKITLDSIGSNYASTTKINENFQKLQDELNDKVHYRDNPVGEGNSLSNDVDMGSNDILNAKDITLIDATGKATSLNAIVGNIKDLVKNNTSWNNRGNWEPSTEYKVNDIWNYGALWYVVLVDYVAGSVVESDINGSNVSVLTSTIGTADDQLQTNGDNRAEYTTTQYVDAASATLDASISTERNRISATEARVTNVEAVNVTQSNDIAAVQAAQIAGVLGYATQADLFADLVPEDSVIAYVTNDTTPSLNGTYRKVGATTTGSWVQESIGPLSTLQAEVDIEKGYSADTIIPSLNLYNSETRTVESFVNWVSGAIQSNVDYFATAFIPVSPSSDYNVTNSTHLAFYDSGYVFISGKQTALDVETTPAGAAFMRLSYLNQFASTVMISKGAALLPYESYGARINPTAITAIGTSSIENGAVTPEKTSFIIPSRNLLDKSTSESGFRGSNGILTASAIYQVTDFIAVTEGSTYVTSKDGISASVRFYTAYNIAKEVIQSEGSDNAATTLTAGTGVAYYKVTYLLEDEEGMQLEEGTVTPFVSAGYSLDSSISAEATTSTWAAKSWVSFGDSITAQNSWQPTVAAMLGLVHTNRGIGGSRISGTGDTAFNNDLRINALPATCDVLTMMGGTNDWAGDVPLGSPAITNVDVNTFYGALNVVINKLTTRFPEARLTVATTPYGELYDYAPRGWSSADINNVGLTTRDYAAACKVAATNWGIPVLEVAERGGWNTLNIRDFIKDDGGLLHPDVTGGKRIAEVVVAGLKTLIL